MDRIIKNWRRIGIGGRTIGRKKKRNIRKS